MGYLAVAKGPHDFYGDPLSRAKPEDKGGLRGIFAKYDPKKSRSPGLGRPGDATVDAGEALGQEGGNKAAAKATFKGHSGVAAGTKGGHMSDSFERDLEDIMERVFFSPTKFHKIGNVPGGRTWPQYESGGNGGSKGETKVVWETPSPKTKKEDVGSNMSPIGTRRSPGETEGGQPPAQFVQGGEGRRRSHESFDRKLDILFEDEWYAGGRPAGAPGMPRSHFTRPREGFSAKPMPRIEGFEFTNEKLMVIRYILDIIDDIIGGADFEYGKSLGDMTFGDVPFDDPESAHRDMSEIFKTEIGDNVRIVDAADEMMRLGETGT